jgi:hypothetical protein
METVSYVVRLLCTCLISVATYHWHAQVGPKVRETNVLWHRDVGQGDQDALDHLKEVDELNRS